MTGSRAQLYNGLALLATFFGCRLVWGTAQSARVYRDMWAAMHTAPSAGYTAAARLNSTNPDENVMAFAAEATTVPVWLVAVYVASNIVLNLLNWHWFFRMIAAVRKRFEPAKKEDGVAAGASDGVAVSTATEKPGLEEVRKRSLADVVPNSDEMELETVQ